jgi:ADP-ribose pyrophosphatase
VINLKKSLDELRNYKETFLNRKKAYYGKSVNFFVDEIKLPNGNKSTREYTKHPGAVTVLPFLDSKRIVLVKQYRYPVHKLTYELPAGKLKQNENPVSCVRRELIEETGFHAKHVKKLISYWPTPAFSTEVIHIYIADTLVPVKGSPDDDEFIDKIILTFDYAFNLIKRGIIRDSKTIIALLLYKIKKERIL